MKKILAIATILIMVSISQAGSIVSITPTNMNVISQTMIPVTVTNNVTITGFNIVGINYNSLDSSWRVIAVAVDSNGNRVKNCIVNIYTNDISAANGGASISTLTVDALNTSVTSVGIQKALSSLTVQPSIPNMMLKHK